MAAKIQNSYEKVYLPYMSFVVGNTFMSFSTFTIGDVHKPQDYR